MTLESHDLVFFQSREDATLREGPIETPWKEGDFFTVERSEDGDAVMYVQEFSGKEVQFRIITDLPEIEVYPDPRKFVPLNIEPYQEPLPGVDYPSDKWVVLAPGISPHAVCWVALRIGAHDTFFDYRYTHLTRINYPYSFVDKLFVGYWNMHFSDEILAEVAQRMPL